jgi:hypothetical protein
MHAGGSGHNGGEKRSVLIVSALLPVACCLKLFIMRCAASRKGASRSWGCDSKPFCCTWQLLPILSCVMDKSKTRLRLPAAYITLCTITMAVRGDHGFVKLMK